MGHLLECAARTVRENAIADRHVQALLEAPVQVVVPLPHVGGVPPVATTRVEWGPEEIVPGRLAQALDVIAPGDQAPTLDPTRLEGEGEHALFSLWGQVVEIVADHGASESSRMTTAWRVSAERVVFFFLASASRRRRSLSVSLNVNVWSRGANFLAGITPSQGCVLMIAPLCTDVKPRHSRAPHSCQSHADPSTSATYRAGRRSALFTSWLLLSPGE